MPGSDVQEPSLLSMCKRDDVQGSFSDNHLLQGFIAKVISYANAISYARKAFEPTSPHLLKQGDPFQCRALLIKYRGLLSECMALLIPDRAAICLDTGGHWKICYMNKPLRTRLLMCKCHLFLRCANVRKSLVRDGLLQKSTVSRLFGTPQKTLLQQSISYRAHCKSSHRFGAMGWLRWVGCLKIQVSLQNTGLFCRALLQKRPIFLSILLIVATPYSAVSRLFGTPQKTMTFAHRKRRWFLHVIQ